MCQGLAGISSSTQKHQRNELGSVEGTSSPALRPVEGGSLGDHRATRRWLAAHRIGLLGHLHPSVGFARQTGHRLAADALAFFHIAFTTRGPAQPGWESGVVFTVDFPVRIPRPLSPIRSASKRSPGFRVCYYLRDYAVPNQIGQVRQLSRNESFQSAMLFSSLDNHLPQYMQLSCGSPLNFPGTGLHGFA